MFAIKTKQADVDRSPFAAIILVIQTGPCGSHGISKVWSPRCVTSFGEFQYGRQFDSVFEDGSKISVWILDTGRAVGHFDSTCRGNSRFFRFGGLL